MIKEENDRVSIIMPVYGVEPYLRKSIESIINQSYRNLEIILVDDGSPDHCPEICDEYANRDKRIKVIHKKNGGQAEARNFGLDLATGDYYYFIDSDDYAEFDAIESLIGMAKLHNADIVVADTNIINEEGTVIERKQYPFPNGIELSSLEAIELFARYDWGPWNKLYTKKTHQDIRFPTGRIHEDEAIMFQLLDRADKCVYTSECKYNYLKRKDSTTSRNYSIKKMDWFYAWVNNYYFVNQYYPSAKKVVLQKVLVTAIYNLNHLIRDKKDFVLQPINDITSFIHKEKRNIMFSGHIRCNYKIRCFMILISLKTYKILISKK